MLHANKDATISESLSLLATGTPRRLGPVDEVPDPQSG